jgi:YD repeat-containing protein
MTAATVRREVNPGGAGILRLRRLLLGVSACFLLGSSLPADAQVLYRFPLCEATAWASTPEAACQASGASLPVCDRPGVTHYSIVSTLTSPSVCSLSWMYTNPGGTTPAPYSTVVALQTNAPAYEGYFGNATCGRLDGWAWDSKQPNSAVTVDIYDGSTLVGTVAANIFRQDLVSAGKGNGAHGFDIELPEILLDGQAHTLYAKFGGTAIGLGTSPKSLSCAPRPPPPPEVESVIPNDPRGQSCDRSPAPAGVKVGKPIIPATGEETLDQADHVGAGPDALSLTRSYRSSRVLGTATGPAAAGLGQPWSHNHSVVLKRAGAAGAAGSTARVVFGNGSVRAFNWDTASAGWTASNSADTLTANATGLLYKRLDDDSTWQFDAGGKLQTSTQRNGWVNSYHYSTASTPSGVAATPGLLISVNNQFGRSLNFTYNAFNQLVRVTASSGQVTRYQYDGTGAASRLSSVSYPASAGTVASRTYLYENATFPQLLTGILDEAGNRYATIGYDSQGRGTSTQLAGAADLHTISYGTAGAAVVTDPLGTVRTYNYGTSMGKLAVTGANLPSGTGGSDAASRVQDAHGFVTQETDFLGVSTMYTWDINRRLPLTVTKAAALPEAQTASTQWHPTFRLPVLVTEAGRTTAYTYDTAGNPLTRTVADTASGASRTTTWTYNAAGQVLTVKGPRTDADDTTRFAYYSTSTGFVDPPVESDPSFDSVSLLLHGDGSNNSTAMVDSASSAKTVAVMGGAKISTVQSKFGGSSMAFDGSDDYLPVASTPGNNFNFGTGDFTIEGWFYLSSAGGDYRILFALPWGSTYMIMGFGNTGFGGRLQFASHGATLATVYSAEHTQASLAGAWHHVAFTRSGGFSRAFLDGNLLTLRNNIFSGAPVTSWADASNIASATQAYVSNSGASGWLGYIDDFRITKGVARYTANFMPPAQAFPNTGLAIDLNTVGHTAGDLQSITNASGHVTQFTLYDRAGRVRQMIDPKGVVTDTTYTPRGWVSSVTVTPPGGTARITRYSYDNVGQLTGVALPDSTTLGYSYDAAHRLTGVTDAKGNTVTYTLDAMGNKVGEQVKDPSGNLQRNITRVYDALNRVQQVTGAGN